jgi:hypothetical protein
MLVLQHKMHTDSACKSGFPAPFLSHLTLLDRPQSCTPGACSYDYDDIMHTLLQVRRQQDFPTLTSPQFTPKPHAQLPCPQLCPRHATDRARSSHTPLHHTCLCHLYRGNQRSRAYAARPPTSITTCQSGTVVPSSSIRGLRICGSRVKMTSRVRDVLRDRLRHTAAPPV